MKVSMFHLMPYRDLPDDFEQKYHSVWVDPPWTELGDAEKVGQYYNWSLDELIHAARAGMDGICVNEHHQNAYGFMPNPNLMGSVLARATNGMDVAVVQMGSTLPTTNPPTRVAEEYGMLDTISGGRLVAGMPLGTAMDATLCAGITPIEQRERYYEAHDLILKAWTADDIFAWNGKYYQLPKVNVWPRPIQQPHPPVWDSRPGQPQHLGICRPAQPLLLFFELLRPQGRQERNGRVLAVHRRARHEPNPYRAGFCSSWPWPKPTPKPKPCMKCISSTSTINPCISRPNTSSRRAIRIIAVWKTISARVSSRAILTSSIVSQLKFKDFVDEGFVIAGSPETVRDMLTDAVTDLRVGNLMVLLHIGSMPHDLTLKNSICSPAKSCPISTICGTTSGRITGGRKSCGPSARPRLRRYKDTREKQMVAVQEQPSVCGKSD